jgi:hypothetical protein
MRTNVQVYWQPKAGNSPAEYEDACWPRQAGEFPGSMHAAVADGATETSFSGLWARLLVSAYGRGRLAEATWNEDLNRIRRVWQRAVGQKPLPWYAEEKLRLGAFAALTGLTLYPPTDGDGSGGEFQALSIGDSCLFQWREGRLIWSFPFTAAEEFNSRPLLIPSLERGTENEVAAQRSDGQWCAGDTFLLMTDALACWTLRAVEAGGDPFALLESIGDPQAFHEFTATHRAQIDSDGNRLLKNDDVTFVVVHLPPNVRHE